MGIELLCFLALDLFREKLNRLKLCYSFSIEYFSNQ